MGADLMISDSLSFYFEDLILLTVLFINKITS